MAQRGGESCLVLLLFFVNTVCPSTLPPDDTTGSTGPPPEADATIMGSSLINFTTKPFAENTVSFTELPPLNDTTTTEGSLPVDDTAVSTELSPLNDKDIPGELPVEYSIVSKEPSSLNEKNRSMKSNQAEDATASTEPSSLNERYDSGGFQPEDTVLSTEISPLDDRNVSKESPQANDTIELSPLSNRSLHEESPSSKDTATSTEPSLLRYRNVSGESPKDTTLPTEVSPSNARNVYEEFLPAEDSNTSTELPLSDRHVPGEPPPAEDTTTGTEHSPEEHTVEVLECSPKNGSSEPEGRHPNARAGGGDAMPSGFPRSEDYVAQAVGERHEDLPELSLLNDSKSRRNISKVVPTPSNSSLHHNVSESPSDPEDKQQRKALEDSWPGLRLTNSPERPEYLRGGVSRIPTKANDAGLTESPKEEEEVTKVSESPIEQEENDAGVTENPQELEENNAVTENPKELEENYQGILADASDVLLIATPQEHEVEAPRVKTEEIKCFTKGPQGHKGMVGHEESNDEVCGSSQEAESMSGMSTASQEPLRGTCPPVDPMNCQVPLALRIYREARQAGTKLPQDCWKLLCSEPEPASLIISLDGSRTYWLQENSSACFSQLPSTQNEDDISKRGAMTPTAKFVILNPSCTQNYAFAFIEANPELRQILPQSCQRSLCSVGAKLLYVSDVSTFILDPNTFNDEKFAENCFHDLTVNARSFNKSNSDIQRLSRNETILNLTEYPVSSPCPTVVIFQALVTGEYLFLVFRDTTCSPLSAAGLRELLISWLSLLQTGQHLHLYRCILRKSSYWTSIINHYLSFLEDAVDDNQVISRLPESCVTFLCNPSIELSFVVRHVSNDTKMWFPYVPNCSESHCQALQSQLTQCQKSIGGTPAREVDGITWVPLPNDGTRKKDVLALTRRWWCPGGSGEGAVGRARADLLAQLWQERRSHLKACRWLVCHATVHNHHRGVTQLFALYSDLKENYPDSCERAATGATYHEDGLSIFSFTLSTANDLMFLISNYSMYDETKAFFALLYSAGQLNISRCCTRYPKEISFTLFNEKIYYTCKYNSTLHNAQNCSSDSNNLWLKKQVTNDAFITIFREGSIPHRWRLLFRWLATLDTSLSNTTITYLLSHTTTASYVFRNNVLYALVEEDVGNHALLNFLSEIQKMDFICNTSREFTMCYNRSDEFPSAQYESVYLLVVHECSINLEVDEAILLLLTQFQKAGVSAEYLCRREVAAAIVPWQVREVAYSTRGSHTSASTVLQRLRDASPAWRWLKDEVGFMWDFITKGWCLRLKDVHKVSSLLAVGNCFYYTSNRSTVFVGPSFKDSYYAVVFPLMKSEGHYNKILLNRVSDVPSDQRVLPFVASRRRPATKLYLDVLIENPVNPAVLGTYSRYMISSAKITMKTLINARLRNDNQCLRDMEDGKFTVRRSQFAMEIGPIHSDLLESSCFLHLPRDTLNELLAFQFNKNLTTINKFWPTCSYNMIWTIFWDAPEVLDWWYLSRSCKIYEMILLCVSGALTLVTVAGNVMVLVVITASGLAQEATFLIRASLALADLLLGLLPASLAVYDHAALMTGTLTLRDLDPETVHAGFSRLRSGQPPGFKQLRFERFGYPTVCSVAFNVSTIVSLLTLALLSVERLSVVLGRPLRRCYVLVGISLTWAFSIFFSLLVNWRQIGFLFAGYFDPITKLTLSIGAGAPSVSLVVFYVEVVIMGIAGVTVVICTVATLALLRYKEHQTQTKLTVHSDVRGKEMRRVTRTFVLMVVMFCVACVLLVVDVVADLTNTHPVAHFFAWWLFIAGASWNWALYSVSGGKFQKHFRSLCGKRPSCLASSQQKTESIWTRNR